MAKRKKGWAGLTRSQKLSSVLWPESLPPALRAEMAALSANERKRPPSGPKLLPDHTRGHVSPLGGQAQPKRKR
jgi:hypothetical protein